MIRFFTALIFMLTCVGTLHAAEKPFTAEIKITTFESTFFNYINQILKVDDIWINEKKCETSLKTICTYDLAGNLALVASADKDTGLIHEFNLIFAKNADVAKFGIISASLMALIDPELSSEKRRDAVIAMINGKGEGNNGREFDGINARYSILASELLGGVFFLMTAK